MSGKSQVSTEFGPPLYLAEIFYDVLRQRVLILAITALCLLIGSVHSYTADRLYTAKTTLIPVNDRQEQPTVNGAISSAISGFGGLLGKGQNAGNAEIALELAKTREFVRLILEKHPKFNHYILPTCSMKASDNTVRACAVGDLWHATNKWKNQIFSAGSQPEVGIYWIEVELPDPDLAAVVANSVVSMMDQKLRVMSLEKTSSNIKYLSAQLQNTANSDVRHTITVLLQRQIEDQMLASNQTAYVFQVLESAVAPAAPSSPKVLMIMIGSGVIGIFLGIIVALIRSSRRAIRGKLLPVFGALE
ncbi:MAG TPA: GNVR domain-containing protein [Pedomonas sp.]|uniref:GNVR domain-containing protein n=1 Tax=Pedomonas sp. TaxID=2976421 RepID=UPI002F40E592